LENQVGKPSWKKISWKKLEKKTTKKKLTFSWKLLNYKIKQVITMNKKQRTKMNKQKKVNRPPIIREFTGQPQSLHTSYNIKKNKVKRIMNKLDNELKTNSKTKKNFYELIDIDASRSEIASEWMGQCETAEDFNRVFKTLGKQLLL